MSYPVKLTVNATIEPAFFAPNPIVTVPNVTEFFISDSADTTNKYNSIFGNNFWTPTLANVQAVWPFNATLTNWYIEKPSNIGVGNSATFTLLRNGSLTTAVATISGASRQGVWTGSLALSANDLVAIQLTAISGVASVVIAGGSLVHVS